jgi:hypothetical protein
LIRITPEAESVVTNLENHITETSRTAKEAAKDAQDYLEEWENSLEELREEFSDHNISMLALAAALDPEFFETAKEAGESWLDGFKDGLPVSFMESHLGEMLDPAETIIEQFLSEITDLASNAQDLMRDTTDVLLAQISAQFQAEIASLSAMIAQLQADLLQLTTKTSGAYGGSDYGGHYWDSGGSYVGSDDYGKGTGQYVGGSDGDQGWEVVDQGDSYYVPGIGNVPKSHKGSMVVGEGIASLTPGELVFPPDLSVQLQRLISTLSVRPLPATQLQTQPQQQWRGGGVEIRGNLLNVEKASFEDETDMEILARELNRQIALLRN